MKFTARVTSADGTPVAAGKVELVSASGAKIIRVASGKITKGILSVTGNPGPVWGLRIDGQPAVAFAKSVSGESVDLGEIVLVPDGTAWPAFHAPDGRVYAIPRAARSASRPAGGKALRADALGDLPSIKTGMTFGDALGSTALQFGKAAAMDPSFTLTAASVKLRGLPTSTDAAIGLDFPTPELASTGVGLSELSFSLKPIIAAGQVTTPAPAGPNVTDVAGYTRELAVRKLVAAGFLAEVSSEVVTDAAGAGRVVRQVPAAGTSYSAGGVVRLFIGKRNGS